MKFAQFKNGNIRLFSALASMKSCVLINNSIIDNIEIEKYICGRMLDLQQAINGMVI